MLDKWLVYLLISVQAGMTGGAGSPNPFFANGIPQAVPTSIQLSAANPFAQVCLLIPFLLLTFSEGEATRKLKLIPIILY